MEFKNHKPSEPLPLSLDPHIQHTMYMADYSNHKGKHSETLMWYDLALNIDPGIAETWYNKGVTLKKTHL